MNRTKIYIRNPAMIMIAFIAFAGLASLVSASRASALPILDRLNVPVVSDLLRPVTTPVTTSQVAPLTIATDQVVQQSAQIASPVTVVSPVNPIATTQTDTVLAPDPAERSQPSQSVESQISQISAIPRASYPVSYASRQISDQEFDYLMTVAVSFVIVALALLSIANVMPDRTFLSSIMAVRLHTT